MKILMTNDDGIYAPGLHSAWRALQNAGHDVFVCVPDRPRSACSHSITMHKPLRANRVETDEGIAFTSNGTPADCVPLALLQLMEWKPELVISGINLGPNLGDDVHYSGTVAGAMEGMLNGVPSVAISLADWENPLWQAACDFCVELAPKVLLMDVPKDTFLNVNVPNLEPAAIKGIRITSQGSRRYKGDIVKYQAPQIGTYYWRGGELVDRSESNDTDILAVREGYVSVTPLHVDLSNQDAMAAVEKVLLHSSNFSGA